MPISFKPVRPCTLAAIAGVCSLAHAEPILGLVGTGSDGMGGTLAVNSAEVNYASSAGLIVVDPVGGYAGAPIGSAWIAPTPTNISDPPGSSFAATLTFDLTGFDPSTAVISGAAAADDGVFVQLNDGDSVFVAGAAALGDFTISDGFVSGINTITFSVGNSNIITFNPTALLVGRLSGTVEVPAPGPAAILLAGFVVCVNRRRG
ncbi:MAG: hypothetical protein AAGI53_16665 [Planctomycetota bacterium]